MTDTPLTMPPIAPAIDPVAIVKIVNCAIVMQHPPCEYFLHDVTRIFI